MPRPSPWDQSQNLVEVDIGYLLYSFFELVLHHGIHGRHDLHGHIDEAFRDDPANMLRAGRCQDGLDRLLFLFRALVEQIGPQGLDACIILATDDV